MSSVWIGRSVSRPEKAAQFAFLILWSFHFLYVHSPILIKLHAIEATAAIIGRVCASVPIANAPDMTSMIVFVVSISWTISLALWGDDREFG